MAAAALGMGDPGRALAALERMYLARGTLFSHEACLVAAEDDQVLGIVTCCVLSELRRRNLATVAPLLRSLGPLNSLALLRRGLLPTGLGPRLLVPRSWRRRGEPPMVSGAGPGDHFVIALAVAPAQRRRGMARDLLGRAHAAALADGAASMTVNVLEGNSAARCLYTGLGYRRVRRFEPDAPDHVGTKGAILSLQADLPGESAGAAPGLHVAG